MYDDPHMDDHPRRFTLGATPGRLVLVAVLAVVLLVVLVVQLSGSDESAATAKLSTASKTDNGSHKNKQTGKNGRPTRQKKTRPKGASSPTAARTGADVAGDSHGAAAAPRTAWPEMSVDEIARHDPFRVPAALASLVPRPAQPRATEVATAEETTAAEQEARKQQQEQYQREVTALRATGVTAVIAGEHGMAAAIGDRVVRVGDVVGGLRIKRIAADGVEVGPATEQE